MSELSPHTKKMLKLERKVEEARALARALKNKPERDKYRALQQKARPRTPDCLMTPSPPTPPSPPPGRKKTKKEKKEEKQRKKQESQRSVSPPTPPTPSPSPPKKKKKKRKKKIKKKNNTSGKGASKD